MSWGRIFKKNGRWYTDIIFQGQRKRKKMSSKKLARRVLEQKLYELDCEENGILEVQKKTLEEFAKEYLVYKEKTTQPSTHT